MPQLAEKNMCIGCTACACICSRNCITMVADKDGFCYPQIDTEVCINCSICEKVCPVLNQSKLQGEQPVAYAALSKDEEMRKDSSSGGVFSEFARTVFSRGGVVYGAAYNKQFDVMHICVKDEAGLAMLRGAKYAQSELGNTFLDIENRLKKGQQVLFSGTPCQVAGLKFFLRKEYENLITVDFVCHGIPSPMAWREYVKYRAQSDNNGVLPVAINLRSKETGWSRYQYSNVFQYADGTSNIAKSGESLFMKLFVKAYISRESCSNCSFKGYSRSSDLTIGDFWGIWDVLPEMDDDKGTSVVLCQSQRGAQLLKEICTKVIIKQVTLEDASQQNNSMLLSTPSNIKRCEALDIIRNGNITACTGWFEDSTLQMPTMKQKLKRIADKLLFSLNYS